MAKRKPKNTEAMGSESLTDYRHGGSKRKNNPPAKIASEGIVPALPLIKYAYSPRSHPSLSFDPTGNQDGLAELLNEARRRPLTGDETRTLALALRSQEPWLEWAGKRESEAQGLAVEPVALTIHERISAKAILKVAARQDVERTLFGDPEHEYHEAVQFYRHDIDWTNRLILGDSLQVMASLARREDLSGKVQMIYMDPPYGIKFASNFQPEIGKRDVKDKESDLTREPEMVRAYRDTWHLGVHSYLTYLRDRLTVAKELLSESGSIFVQINDENVHRVRLILDEVFGPEQFCSLITYRTKTMPLGSEVTEAIGDYIVWYCKNLEKREVWPLFVSKNVEGDASWSWIELPTGERRPLSQKEVLDHSLLPDGARLYQPISMLPAQYRPNQDFTVQYNGQTRYPPKRSCWATDKMERLLSTDRVHPSGETLRYVLYHDDYPVMRLSNIWSDTAGARDKRYVVKTSAEVIKRCILLSTKPGDLVLDPTCGGGTTAKVAEEWGRRWITIDTSRVAVAITRQEILTGRYDYFKLKHESAGLSSGFICKSAPHVTRGSIAQNSNLDPILAKHRPIMEARLQACNIALASLTADVQRRLELKLIDKQRAEGKRSVTDADRRRWELPQKGQKWEHWTVPFDTDPDWPPSLAEAVEEYRSAWRVRMDEINACIAANAEQEELVDQPEKLPGVVRVSGPFTIEAVQPPEFSLGGGASGDGLFDGEPEELQNSFSVRPSGQMNGEARNAEAYLDQMLRLLRLDGVRFPDNKHSTFSRLERVSGTEGGLHAEGRWAADGEADPEPDGRATVAVAFGPQYGPVTAKQIEDVIRSASRRGYDALVVAGFSFDGPAQAIIHEAQHPRLRIHMANIRPDVNPGMNGLLKDQPGSQLFTVFGQPRTTLQGPDGMGEFQVVMEGVDIYDPVTNTIRSTEDQKVAAWFLDTDYDGRTFCMTQAFFPDKSAWEKLSKALGGLIDPNRFEALSGTTSLPFPSGKHKSVAVKVIDPRGNEVMQVHRLG